MNPSEKDCWVACVSCHRCADKGRWGARCNSCSGRHDPHERFYSDPDDFCDCRNGVLRWKTQKGKRLVARIAGSPFGGGVQAEKSTTDERDWQAFLKEQRERLNNEDWDPILFDDDTSTDAWFK